MTQTRILPTSKEGPTPRATSEARDAAGATRVCACRLATRAQAVEHPRDAIEKRVAPLEIVGLDVAPSDRHAQRGARLGIGPRGGREARETMTALAAVALRDVEGAGAERASKLLSQIAVVVADLRDRMAKNFDSADGEVQNEETWEVRWSCLHALPSERTVTAPPSALDEAGAGAVLSR